jgi:prepilin-type N-terminal cleavage/methylation domain-containing protein
MKSKHVNQKGFTIVELMIATAVFAVVLLLCTYGLLEIGRMYYKGITSTRTQETTRRILDEAADAIKFSGGTVERHEASGWHCLGNKRFSFVRGRQLTTTNHAVVSDIVGTCSSGTNRLNIDSAAAVNAANAATEQLNTRMRLARFSVEEINDTTYRITVRVATGDDDLLNDSLDANGNAGADGVRDSCRGGPGSQFCAVSELTTTVQKRV